MLTLALLLLGAGGTVSATKLYATYGTPASQGSWDAETSTYSWTASYSNLMTIFTFSAGELADYTSLHLTTSDYETGPYRVCFMNGGTAVATIAFYSAGQKDLVLSERTETKDLDLSQITHISFGGASGAGSIKLASTPYLEKPTTVDFDENGIALIGLSDISADVNLTYDDQTGEMTSAAGKGTFTVTLNNADFSSVTKVELLRSGDDIVQTMQITDADNGVLNTWYGSKYSCNFTDYQDRASKITRLAWNCNTAGTMTITGIRLTASVVIANNPHYTTLTKDLFHKWTGVDADAEPTAETVYPSCELNTALAGGSTVYGDANVSNLCYADLTDYDKLVINGTAGTSLRVLLNRQADNSLTELTPTFGSNGVIEVDLSVYKASPGYVHLNAIKRPWDGATATITALQLYKESVSSPYDYIISGSGVLTASALEALADETATAIDATAITKATALATANPNCLVVAADGMVTNSQNVIVGNTCANLVLTDGYPFKAPADFTATAAAYNTTVSTTAQAGTLCLPFAVAIPEDVEAYTLTYAGGDKVTATPIETATIPANTPVLLNASGAQAFAGASEEIDADADNVGGALTGVFASSYVPQDSYVLQEQDGNVGFYKVDADSKITVKPFRAYLTAAASARTLTIEFEEGGTTGIEIVNHTPLNASQVYDLQGRGVTQPAKGLYIVGGRKVLVK